MSGNPYIDEVGYLDEGPVSGSRTSVLAVASLATSLICCIPLLGVLSIVMGVSSLVLIGRSNGRLTGRGAAIAGLIVGIMTSVIWGAAVAGVLQAQRYYITQMVPPAEVAFGSVATRDVATFRTVLNHDATNDLNDARIELFMEAFETEFGGFQSVATDWGTLFESFAETYSSSHSQGNNSVQINNVTPVPIGVVGQNKKRVVWVIFDESSIKGGTPYIADLMVMVDGTDSFVLREDGPGLKMAHAMWLNVTPLEDVVKAPAAPPGPDEASEESGG